MEKRCHKCGSPVGAEQAFCPTCGAVIGMDLGTTQAGGGWDLASTVVGKPPSTPQRSTAERGGRPSRPEAAAPAPPRKSNSLLLAVIGFVAVLLIGGLVVLLLYLK
ncbi:MAG: zinc-ribbon domain-containing protein [Pyrinomonadaceae bacterium]